MVFRGLERPQPDCVWERAQQSDYFELYRLLPAPLNTWTHS